MSRLQKANSTKLHLKSESINQGHKNYVSYICFDVNHEAILHKFQSLHIKKTKHPDIAYTHDAENHWFNSRHVFVFIYTLVFFPTLIASIKLGTCKTCNLEAAW